MAVIGAGRVGTTFAVLLERAGHRVVAASGRSGSRQRVRRYLPFAKFFPITEAHEAARAAAVVLLSVPDDLIVVACSDLAGRVAFRRGQHVVHLSGSVGLDALQAAHLSSAEILSLHPLQSFPDVDEGIARLPGSAVAVTALDEEGYRMGELLAGDVGGAPFRLPDDVKPLYHAAAVFCSNYLVTVAGVAEGLFRLAGLKEPLPMFAPLARSTLEVALSRGPQEALTGPAARGEAGTISRNLEALAKHAPEAVGPYIALAQMAAGLASRSGKLSPQGRARVEKALSRWR